jgi:hypothetical protein
LHEIDYTVVTEAGYPVSGGSVEHYKLISERNVNDLPTGSVISIRKSATRKSPWRYGTTFPLVEAVHPKQFTGPSIGRNNRSA